MAESDVGKRTDRARALLLVVLLALIPACGGPNDSTSRSPSVDPPPPPSPRTPDGPIKHVFVILKARHSYDSLFFSYPNASPSRIVNSDGKTYMLSEPGSDHWDPVDESWEASHEQFNGGAMNGFVQPPEFMSGPFVTYGVTPETGRRRLPYYWFLADQGVLSDRWFGFQFGPEFPNLLGVLAASSGGAISNPSGGSFDVLDPATGKKTRQSSISSTAVPTALPARVEQSGLTWAIFQESGATVSLAKAAATLDILRALPGYGSSVTSVSKLDTSLPDLLAQGKHGHLTFLQPGDPNNELPVNSDLRNAEKWTRSVVDAIGQSADWNNCAILILWTSYGGYYDRVAPPQVDGFGMGFRVPCLIVSPFARRGLVQSALRDHSSIARFCESIFGLTPMNGRDGSADDLLSAFDLTQAPRPYSDFVPPDPPPLDPDFETFPSEGRTHVPPGTVVDYKTDPPTSGNHYPDPQQGGFYTEPILSGYLVHSMEHGGVIIYYDSTLVSAADLDALKTLAAQHGGLQAQICCVPRSDTTYPIILTSWCHRLRLPAYDAARIQGFLNEYLGRGPE